MSSLYELLEGHKCHDKEQGKKDWECQCKSLLLNMVAGVGEGVVMKFK